MATGAKRNYWLLSAFFFFYFFTWSSCMSLFSIWLGQDIQLSGASTGIIFSANAIVALVMQPLYGVISDKIGMKKHVLWFIVGLLVFSGPFFIYVYGPLLKFNVLLGAIVGGLFLGAAFQAGCGAVESYIEKVGRKCDFEYGKSRMWGSLGWAAATFFAGQLFNINPNINFWLASGSALCLVLILLMTKIDLTANAEEAKQEPIKMADVFGLLKMKKFWFFVMYVFGVVCFYNVYDQQFPNYYSSLFSDTATGNQIYGYLNSFQVFLEAGMMFAAPFIVNKLGAKKSLLFAGFVMSVRITGSGLAVEPIGISCMKLLHALELPIMLIAIFKYLAQHFDNRLSSTLYLVGFQFASAIAAAFLSPFIGQLYDSIGFSKVYFIIGGVVLFSNIISMFTLSNDLKETEAVQEAQAS